MSVKDHLSRFLMMSVVNLETISVRENLKDQETQQLAPVLKWSRKKQESEVCIWVSVASGC